MKDQKKTAEWRNRKISRRDFMAATATTMAAFTIVPRYVLGGAGFTPPSEKLNIACIGTGGQGTNDMEQFLAMPDVQIVAVCDVSTVTDYSDFYYSGKGGREPARQIVEAHYAEQKPQGTYKGCAAYTDFRRMLQEQENIDAVLVATPDHLHAVVSMTAIKMGKHVYCEKPLTHTVYEARKLAEAARQHKVVTQMGIQLHATNALKILVEIIKSGAIGKVREVHLWSNKPIEPHAADRPGETPQVPSGLDWDLWLGPAPYRPYNPAYLPFKWRFWWDFGTGRLGDMGCHIFDPAFWALELGSPTSIEAQTIEFNSEVYPDTSVIRYEFGARGKLPPVELTWYNGGIFPWRPPELEEGRDLPGQGGLYVGENGTILAPHGDGPRLIPESKMKGFKRPKPFLPRGFDHYQEWVRACKGGTKPLANFDYSGQLTEAVLLGNVAIRTGKKLYWDGQNLKVTNVPEANEYLHRQYRQGWTL